MFARGQPEGIETIASTQWQASLYDLLTAYASQRQKRVLAHVTVRQRVVWSLADARGALERIVGRALDWTVLDDFLVEYCVSPELARTVRASAFSASLEMVREGELDLRQERPFAPLWVRKRRQADRPALSVVV
jgi:segregation and condensation protein A